MASPTNPKSTVRTRATRTIAWPRWAPRRIANSVLGLVGGCRVDDDVIDRQLLDQRGDRNKVVANGYLQRRVVVRRQCRAARPIGFRPHLPTRGVPGADVALRHALEVREGLQRRCVWLRDGEQT